jgi:glycosyltransferase involved in cell wall biosynthesis
MYFSIIIPTFNRESIVTRAIRTILDQSFQDLEIIVVDDGSTDTTEQAIRLMASDKIRYFKTENFGVAHARNTGIKMAVGKYIGFLDSDDLFETAHLKNAYEFIQECKEPAIIHLNFLWGAEDRSRVHANALPKKLPDDLFKGCFLHVNCTFLRSDIAKKNLFNESRELMFVEDWDFFIKLSIRYPIHLLNKCSSYLIDHDERNMRKFDLEKWEIRRDALQKSLMEDEIMSANFLHKIKRVIAHMNSLIAVNLVIRKKRANGIQFFLKAISQSPQELFSMRTLAIFKHLFF